MTALEAPPMLQDRVSGVWYVASFSGPSVVYRVAPDGQDCSCPYSFFRRVTCKHQEAVIATLQEARSVA